MDTKDVKPGDEIKIKVEGEEFVTIIDEKGVQRFPTNSLFRYLVDVGMVNLNDLTHAYQESKFSKREYMLFNMGLNYSVCGLCELPSFEDLEILNPLWEEAQ